MSWRRLSPKLASLVLATGALTVFGGCVQSTDDIRKEQDQAWVAQIAAIAQDIGPPQARVSQQIESGFASGNVSEITQAFSEYDQFVSSIQRRVNQVEPPAQFADEQRVVSQFITTVRRLNSRLSDPTLEISDLPALFSSLDPEVRQAEANLREVLRQKRC